MTDRTKVPTEEFGFWKPGKSGTQAMSDPEFIYLQPACCVDPHEGRLWCEDDVWPTWDDDCDQPGVRYIRFDLVAHHVAAPERKG